jgi:hypothetical protein
MSKRPAFQFYPSDWRNDPGLRLCSCGARGLWADMLCLMHEGDPYGHLTVLGRPIEPQSLARLVGESLGSVKKWLKELADNEVFSKTPEGVIYSRRMVRDEDLRERRAAGGPSGAAHGKKGAEFGSKGGRPKAEKTPHDGNGRGDTKPPLKPPPSSSSSSSSSSPSAAGKETLPEDVRAIMDATGWTHPPGDMGLRNQWYEAGADLEQDIVPILKRETAKLRGKGQPPRYLKVFEGSILEKLAADAAEIERLKGISRRYQDEAAAAGGGR